MMCQSKKWTIGGLNLCILSIFINQSPPLVKHLTIISICRLFFFFEIPFDILKIPIIYHYLNFLYIFLIICLVIILKNGTKNNF